MNTFLISFSLKAPPSPHHQLFCSVEFLIFLSSLVEIMYHSSRKPRRLLFCNNSHNLHYISSFTVPSSHSMLLFFTNIENIIVEHYANK